MKKETTIAPKGTRDIYTPEIEIWQYLEEKVRTFFKRFLYKEIRTPIFEYSELFQRGIGSNTEVVQKEMYTFHDKSNRSLTLRPENTASVVRAAIEANLFNVVFPFKMFYIGPMFRYDKPQKGRYRQFHQFGVEVFGDQSPEIDAEVIFAGFEFLKDIHLTDIILHINSVGCQKCHVHYTKLLQVSAEKKINRLCSDCQRKVNTNPLRIFDCKKPGCIRIASHFPKITDHLCQDCNQHFHQLKEVLSTLETPFQINPQLVRGLDYYTRTVFEITSKKLGSQDALIGGGRYDNLVKELGGPDIPATGFAAGIERILIHLESIQTTPEKILYIAYQNPKFMKDAIKLSKTLWREGITALMDYNPKNIKKQFKKADRSGATHTLVLGEEELKNETISIKNMATQQQVSIPRQELMTWLERN